MISAARSASMLAERAGGLAIAWALRHSPYVGASTVVQRAPCIHRCRTTLAARKRSSDAADTSSNDVDDLPPQARVGLEKKDQSLRELLIQVMDGSLNLQPQYQRGLVWDRKMASRLVVTALEGRVVPTIYLEETEDGKYMMMDGKQRLTSLLCFLAGSNKIGDITWDNAPVQLDLNEESCDPRWNGKRFVDLPKDRQRKLKSYSIQTVIVSSDTDRDVVYGIYQDINTGAVGHTEQQNRKAAFHGPYINLLDELASNQEFLNIQGKEAPDSEKEYDRELILRFFAMLRSADSFTTPLMRFLNKEVRVYQNADEAEIDRLREVFKITAATVWQIFGQAACRFPKTDSTLPASNSKAKKSYDLHASLWDATMVAVQQELRQDKNRRRELVQAADAIRAAFVKLCGDSDFKTSLENRSKRNVMKRIQLMRQLLQTAAPCRRWTPRAYSQQMRWQLWQLAVSDDAQQRKCGICRQVIHRFEDCEVDHITPYSLGGETTMENAQLVHRYCNRNKGNRVTSEAQVL